MQSFVGKHHFVSSVCEACGCLFLKEIKPSWSYVCQKTLAVLGKQTTHIHLGRELI